MDYMRIPKNFDIDTVPLEDLDELSKKLGKAIGDIVDKASIKANKILNPFGLKVKLSAATEPLEQVTPTQNQTQPEEAK